MMGPTDKRAYPTTFIKCLWHKADVGVCGEVVDVKKDTAFRMTVAENLHTYS